MLSLPSASMADLKLWSQEHALTRNSPGRGSTMKGLIVGGLAIALGIAAASAWAEETDWRPARPVAPAAANSGPITLSAPVAAPGSIQQSSWSSSSGNSASQVRAKLLDT